MAPVQQPLLVTANARPPVEDHQPLPPRGATSTHGTNQQQQNIPNQASVRQQEHQHVGSTNLYVSSFNKLFQIEWYFLLGMASRTQVKQTVMVDLAIRILNHNSKKLQSLAHSH